MAAVEKTKDVTLEEALTIAGTGRYTAYVVLAGGFILFGSMMNSQAMSIVLPAAGCELHLTSSEKGILTSIVFAGMLLSGPLSGCLSDAFGRVRVSFWGLFSSFCLIFLNTFAPNNTALLIINFVNGFVLTGAVTPVFVMVSEFCCQDFRGKALIICATASTLVNLYLPGMALMIMPLDIQIPIFGVLNFSSWRLYILLSAIPNAIALFLLWRLPETPKFLLIQGHSEKTLKILKHIYAMNQRKRKDEFPVHNIILDSIDKDYASVKNNGNRFLNTLKEMMSRMKLLFQRQYIIYTLMSCAILFTQVGMYNVFILWLPEQLSRMNRYIENNGVYEATLCDLMMSTGTPVQNIDDCAINFDFFTYGIILGIIQFLVGIFVTLYADKIGKKVILVGFLFLASGMSFSLLFANIQYLIIAMLIMPTILVSVSFPITATFLMEFYPTYARSTANAVAMIFGRLGASVGNQIMGLLYDNHCEKAFYGITAILAATATLCLFIPSKTNK